MGRIEVNLGHQIYTARATNALNGTVSLEDIFSRRAQEEERDMKKSLLVDVDCGVQILGHCLPKGVEFEFFVGGSCGHGHVCLCMITL